jgi:hypothetical protein
MVSLALYWLLIEISPSAATATVAEKTRMNAMIA